MFDQPGGGVIELALGGSGPATATPRCPVGVREPARSDGGTVEEYRLRGAGPVRGTDGGVLTDAATLVIGLTGDAVTSTHPVVRGVAVVDASRPPPRRPSSWTGTTCRASPDRSTTRTAHCWPPATPEGVLWLRGSGFAPLHWRP